MDSIMGTCWDWSQFSGWQTGYSQGCIRSERDILFYRDSSHIGRMQSSVLFSLEGILCVVWQGKRTCCSKKLTKSVGLVQASQTLGQGKSLLCASPKLLPFPSGSYGGDL